MTCSVQPLPPHIANYIEFWNLYCQYNQAWIEMYLNMCNWYTPYLNKGETK